MSRDDGDKRVSFALLKGHKSKEGSLRVKERRAGSGEDFCRGAGEYWECIECV